MAGKADEKGSRGPMNENGTGSEPESDQRGRSKHPLSVPPGGDKAPEQLRAENRRLQHALELLRDNCDEAAMLLSACSAAMVFVDDQLRLRHFTPAAGELLGLSEADLGRPLDPESGCVYSLGICADLRSALDSGKQLSSEVYTERGQWLVKHVRSVRGDQGRIEGAVATLEDQTHRVQREKDLQQIGRAHV